VVKEIYRNQVWFGIFCSSLRIGEYIRTVAIELICAPYF
jgi:hypothetical protein